MVIEEENIVNNKFELKSSPVHFEIKNPIDIDMDYIKDTLADTGLYIWEYRVQGNNEENNYMNNYNIYNEGFNADNLDYYFLYKLEMEIDNGENRRKARSKSTRKKRNNNELNYNIDNRLYNQSSKKMIEMVNLDDKNTSHSEEKKGINEKFSLDNKITCTLRILNFTNYIFKGKNFNIISKIKKSFNKNFKNFYNEIKLENNKKICLENGIIYIKSEKEKMNNFNKSKTINDININGDNNKNNTIGKNSNNDNKNDTIGKNSNNGNKNNTMVKNTISNNKNDTTGKNNSNEDKNNTLVKNNSNDNKNNTIGKNNNKDNKKSTIDDNNNENTNNKNDNDGNKINDKDNKNKDDYNNNGINNKNMNDKFNNKDDTLNKKDTLNSLDFRKKTNSTGHAPKTEEEKTEIENDKIILKYIKNINYNEKISILKPFIFRADFKRKNEYDFLINLSDIEKKTDNGKLLKKKDNDEADNETINIKELDLNINSGNDGLMKKGVLTIISIILFIIIIIKLF